MVQLLNCTFLILFSGNSFRPVKYLVVFTEKDVTATKTFTRGPRAFMLMQLNCQPFSHLSFFAAACHHLERRV